MSESKMKFGEGLWPNGDTNHSLPEEYVERLEKSFCANERKKLLEGSFKCTPNPCIQKGIEDIAKRMSSAMDKRLEKELLAQHKKKEIPDVFEHIAQMDPRVRCRCVAIPKITPPDTTGIKVTPDSLRPVAIEAKKKSLVNHLRDREVIGELKEQSLPSKATNLFDYSVKYNPIINNR